MIYHNQPPEAQVKVHESVTFTINPNFMHWSYQTKKFHTYLASSIAQALPYRFSRPKNVSASLTVKLELLYFWPNAHDHLLTEIPFFA